MKKFFVLGLSDVVFIMLTNVVVFVLFCVFFFVFKAIPFNPGVIHSVTLHSSLEQ